MPEAWSAIQQLDKDVWCAKPINEPSIKVFFILRWKDLRQAPGFEKALAAQRDSLLLKLKEQRWTELVDASRKAAKIEPLK
jgi:hypothetical protein